LMVCLVWYMKDEVQACTLRELLEGRNSLDGTTDRLFDSPFVCTAPRYAREIVPR